MHQLTITKNNNLHYLVDYFEYEFERNDFEARLERAKEIYSLASEDKLTDDLDNEYKKLTGLRLRLLLNGKEVFTPTEIAEQLYIDLTPRQTKTEMVISCLKNSTTPLTLEEIADYLNKNNNMDYLGNDVRVLLKRLVKENIAIETTPKKNMYQRNILCYQIKK